MLHERLLSLHYTTQLFCSCGDPKLGLNFNSAKEDSCGSGFVAENLTFLSLLVVQPVSIVREAIALGFGIFKLDMLIHQAVQSWIER
jgi:hypothetical protein